MCPERTLDCLAGLGGFEPPEDGSPNSPSTGEERAQNVSTSIRIRQTFTIKQRLQIRILPPRQCGLREPRAPHCRLRAAALERTALLTHLFLQLPACRPFGYGRRVPIADQQCGRAMGTYVVFRSDTFSFSRLRAHCLFGLQEPQLADRFPSGWPALRR
jgi:hypothetical protein